MTEKSWKQAERRVAELLGTNRVPISGAAPFGKKGDVDLAGYIIDVKTGRRQIPKCVEKWLEAIRKIGKARDELPLLVFQPYRRHERLVVMTLDDFARVRDVERRVATEDLRRHSHGDAVRSYRQDIAQPRTARPSPGPRRGRPIVERVVIRREYSSVDREAALKYARTPVSR